jgi:hypothetical protein
MSKSHRPSPPEFGQRMVELVRKGRTFEELEQQLEPSWFARESHALPSPRGLAPVPRRRTRCGGSPRGRLGDSNASSEGFVPTPLEIAVAQRRSVVKMLLRPAATNTASRRHGPELGIQAGR